jgi:uncharacterized protein (TIGR02118 family)
MFTMVYACRRVPGMSREEYAAYYQEKHAPLSRALPGLIEYRQMIVRGDFVWDGRNPEFDSVSTYVFPDEETARAAWASPQGIALDEDTPRFMDWETILALPGHGVHVYQPLS